MKVTMAQQIRIYLCEHCSSVHIGFFRNGELFAEAIPNDAELVLDEMVAAVIVSRERAAPKGHRH